MSHTFGRYTTTPSRNARLGGRPPAPRSRKSPPSSASTPPAPTTPPPYRPCGPVLAALTRRRRFRSRHPPTCTACHGNHLHAEHVWVHTPHATIHHHRPVGHPVRGGSWLNGPYHPHAKEDTRCLQIPGSEDVNMFACLFIFFKCSELFNAVTLREGFTFKERKRNT